MATKLQQSFEVVTKPRGIMASPPAKVCSACTLENDADASRCAACEKPFFKRPRVDVPSHAPARTGAFKPAGPRGVLVTCGLLKNCGNRCTYTAAQADVTAHQKTVGYHSNERERLATNATRQAAVHQMWQGASTSSHGASTSYQPTLPAKRPAEQLPQHELPASQQMSVDHTLSALVQAVSQLSLDQQSLVEGLLQHQKVTSSASRPVREELVAQAVVRRLDEREKEQAKSAAQRDAEAAKTKLDRALEKAKSINECCSALGCFDYSPAEELVFCNICTPFVANPDLQRRIPGVQVSFSSLNKRKFGVIDASLGDGSPAQIGRKLSKIKQSLKGHLETQGHFYCVSNRVRAHCSNCSTLCSRLTDCANSTVLGSARSQEQGAAADRSERGVHRFRVHP